MDTLIKLTHNMSGNKHPKYSDYHIDIYTTIKMFSSIASDEVITEATSMVG